MLLQQHLNLSDGNLKRKNKNKTILNPKKLSVIKDAIHNCKIMKVANSTDFSTFQMTQLLSI